MFFSLFIYFNVFVLNMYTKFHWICFFLFLILEIEYDNKFYIESRTVFFIKNIDLFFI